MYPICSLARQNQERCGAIRIATLYRRLSGIADSAEYASLFSVLVATLAEEEESAVDRPGSGRLID
jgi:hypothetical protein